MMNPDKVLAQISDAVIEHPAFVEARETILRGIAYGSTGRVIVVAGPSGVGKTRLLRNIDELFISRWRKDAHSNESPPLVLEAIAPDRGSFAWNAFFYDALIGLNELSPNRKRCLNSAKGRNAEATYSRPRQRASTNELRRMVIDAIKIKKPCMMLIDEAQLLGRVRTRTKLGENLDVIKGLANATNCNIIMFGTSESRDMLYANAQLSRRVSVIHFRRYKKTKRGVEDYLLSLNSLIREMKLPVHDSVYQDPLYFYDHGLGCVGVLIEWLMRAFECQTDRGDAQLTMAHFKMTRLSDMTLKTMLKEALAFEALQSSSDYFDYDSCVQLDIFGEHLSHEGLLKTPKNNRVAIKRKPGQRLPKRDPVGDA